MRAKAEANGQDLLVIDTGDRVEGNGLYDASDPKGAYTFDILKEQHIDVICSGNHELYKQNSSETEYLITVPDFKGNYLASNLDIYDPETGDRVPLAQRYRKFATKKQGIRVLAFGFIFDFRGNYNNTVVQPVEDTIKETWFQEAIRDREVDLFLITGHVPVRNSPEFDAIYKTIRAVQWDTPIQFFGGHTHIRDYAKYDSKAYGMESGRYMETIGFQSISGLSTGSKKDLGEEASISFSRKYIDNNLYSMYHHTGLNQSTFHSEKGKNISRAIKNARSALDLDDTFGCSRKNLWTNRAQYPSNDSIFTWLEKQVLPDIVNDSSRADVPRLVIVNTGGIRYDIFKGPFTKDSTFIVSPFTSGFRFIKDVPYEKADKLLALLNNNGEVFEATKQELQSWMLAPPEQRAILEDVVSCRDPAESSAIPSTVRDQEVLDIKKPVLTPGYTTKDDAGTDGDDTIHSQINFYRVPNCIQAIVNPASDGVPTQPPEAPATVDIVYIEFVEPWILLAMRFLGLEYSLADTDAYMYGESLTTLLAKWVKENWGGNC
jgi:hypothetical protein